MARFAQRLDDVAADVPGAAGDENFHFRISFCIGNNRELSPFSVLFHHMTLML